MGLAPGCPYTTAEDDNCAEQPIGECRRCIADSYLANYIVVVQMSQLRAVSTNPSVKEGLDHMVDEAIELFIRTIL